MVFKVSNHRTRPTIIVKVAQTTTSQPWILRKRRLSGSMKAGRAVRNVAKTKIELTSAAG